MKTMKQFLLAGAIALGAMTLVTACSDKNTDGDNGSSWDAAKIAGDVTGTWWGEYGNRKAVTFDNGKTMRGVKSIQGFEFNSDGTGTCYNFLTNTVTEPLELFGGSMDAKNGAFTWTSNADSTITITRTGDGDAENPKTWMAALTKDGLKVNYGTKEFSMDTAQDFQEELLSEWEQKLRKGSNSEIADSSFLVNWWNHKTVTLSGSAGTVYTPWGDYSGVAQQFDIPSNIRYYNSDENGWKMCFAYLNSPYDKFTHYFALYNPKTAVLRLFFWAEDATEYGNEVIFDLIASNDDNLRYPLYHAMQFGIPANHSIKGKTLRKSANLSSASTTKTGAWEWYNSPYSTKSENNKVSAGWHVVDYDLSAYVPSETQWLDGIEEDYLPFFTIDVLGKETSSVTLTGQLTGSISGTMETYKTEVESSSSNAAMSTASNILSGLGSCASSAGMAGMMTKMLNPPAGGGGGGGGNAGGGNQGHPAPRRVSASGIIYPGLSWLGVGCSLVSNILEWANGTTYTTKVDTIPSKIDLDLDASIDLTGSIETWKSNNAAGIDITKGLLEDANDSIILGQGLWSLAQDPVMYIDEEDILSSSTQFTLKKASSGYTNSSFAEDSVRLVCWLDPNSIKVNINTEVYHNIDSLQVNMGYAVTYNRDLGYTDCYRNLMYLDDRPSFGFYDGVATDDKIRFNTTGSLTDAEKNAGYKLAKQRIIKIDPQEMANWYDEDFWKQKTDNEYCENSFELIEQDTDDNGTIRYVGPTYSICGTDKVVFPQVFVPYDMTDDDDDDDDATTSKIYNGLSPDFFVWVNVAFKCDEGTMEFNKQFIPIVKLIDHNTTVSKYEELVSFMNKAEANKPVGTLANDASFDVYAPYANKGYAPFMKMLEKVKNR